MGTPPLKRAVDGELLKLGKAAGRVRGFFRSTATPALISRGCIMALTDIHSSGEGIFEPALADGSQFADEALPGALYIYTGPTASADKFDTDALRRMTHPWAAEAMVIDFDTSGLNNGDYIYLQDTVNGTSGLNIGSTPGTQPLAVGRCLGTGAVAGKVMLCPMEAAGNFAAATTFNKALAKGNLTFGTAATTATASLGAKYANGYAVVSQKSITGTPAAAEVTYAINGSGVLTVTLSAAPGAGASRVFTYFALPA